MLMEVKKASEGMLDGSWQRMGRIGPSDQHEKSEALSDMV